MFFLFISGFLRCCDRCLNVDCGCRHKPTLLDMTSSWQFFLLENILSIWQTETWGVIVFNQKLKPEDATRRQKTMCLVYPNKTIKCVKIWNKRRVEKVGTQKKTVYSPYQISQIYWEKSEKSRQHWSIATYKLSQEWPFFSWPTNTSLSRQLTTVGASNDDLGAVVK